MDIKPDGSLDYPDDVLKELDYVIAAIHQSFNQSEEEIMNRLRTACENQYVRHIAHQQEELLVEDMDTVRILMNLLKWQEKLIQY